MITATGLAALVSFLAVGLFLALASRRNLVDRPGHRSSHTAPTPTGAGLALIGSLLVTVGFVGFEPTPARLGGQGFPPVFGLLVAVAFGLSVLGLWDDVRGVAARWRLLAQLLASTALALYLPLPTPWLLPPVVLGLTWTMNAFNFMDGSDGMAGLQALLGGMALAVFFSRAGEDALALAALSVSAVALGYLPWNWPPARCFMGDAGSVPLGWLLGALSLLGAIQGSLSWPVVLLLLAVFHVDAGLTLLRRIRAGERWYTAHRTHVYQKLMAQGWTHGQVLVAYAALNLFIVAPALAVAGLRPQWGWMAAITALMTLALAWYAVSLKLGESDERQ